MTRFDELLRKANGGKPPRSTFRDAEHRLQSECVKWFHLQFPQLRGRLFAVPNGGERSKAQAARLSAEGVLAGVSDLILLLPNARFGALLIEMKTTAPHSRQSQAQRWWQEVITARGEYQYIVCRTFDEFRERVTHYINDQQ